MYPQSKKKFFFLHVLITVSLFCHGIFAGVNDEGQLAPQSKYYKLLDSIQTKAPDQQIDALQSFINHYPGCESAYLTLYFLYCKQNKRQDAFACFNDLAHQLLDPTYCHWILGKLYSQDNKIDEAFYHFKSAANSLNSVDMIYDIVGFYHQNRQNSSILLTEMFSDSTLAQKSRLLLLHKEKLYDRFLNKVNALDIKKYDELGWLHFIGTSYYRLGKINSADSVWSHGLKLARTEADWHFVARFLTDRGVIERARKQYNRALALYDSSDALAYRYYNYRQLHINASNRGNIYNLIQEYDKAEGAYKNAIDMAQRFGYIDYVVYWAYNYADCAVEAEKYYDALTYYNLAATTARRVNDRSMFTVCQIAKADLYAYFDLGAMARKIVQQAIADCPDKNLVYYGQALLANFMLEIKEYEKARRYYKQYIDFLSDQGDTYFQTYWMSKLAESYRHENKLDEAIKIYKKVIRMTDDVGQRSSKAWYQTELADILSLEGFFQDAFAYCEVAAEIVLSEGADDLCIRFYNTFGNVYRRMGDYQNAIVQYKKAMPYIEKYENELSAEQLRIGFISSRYELFRNLVHCYYAQYLCSTSAADIDSVFYYDQLARGRDYRSGYSASMNSSRPAAVTYFNRCQSLRNFQRHLRVSSANPDRQLNYLKQITAWEAHKLSLLEARIQFERDEINRKDGGKRTPLDLGELKAILAKNSGAFISYHLSPHGCFAIVFVENQMNLIPLDVDVGTLEDLVDSLMSPFYKLADSHSIKTLPYRADVAHQLYKHLVEPIEDVVALPNRLIVQPDVILYTLPFDILLTEKAEREEYHVTDFPDYQDKFLIHKYSITFTPTPETISSQPEPIPKKVNVHIFANPAPHPGIDHSDVDSMRSFTGWNFSPLPFAEKEAFDIAKIYPRAHIYTQAMATKKKSLRLPAKGILHFATHGFIDVNFELFSGIVLSLDDEDDGLLLGYEVLDKRLEYDLVVLNACETARGQTVPGEGLLGLSRIFLNAGAQCVLNTHWKVDDSFGAKFIVKFYENFFKHDFTIENSLHEAKLYFLNDDISQKEKYFQHPFYWAPYTLYGNANRINKESKIFPLKIIAIVLVFFIFLFILFRVNKLRFGSHTLF